MQSSDLAKERQAARELEASAMLRGAGAPHRHLQAHTTLKPHPLWDEAHDKTLTALRHKGIVALIGSPGSGKTQIGVEMICRAAAALCWPRYIVLADLFASIRESYGPAPVKSERAAIAAFVSPGLLVIDEIDKRGGTDAEQRVLHRILDGRYAAMRPTLLIGNVASVDQLQSLLDGFAGEGIGPLYDRIRQSGGVVEAFGWSFRQGGKQ